MQQIKEYKIVVGVEGGSKFSDEVNQLISEGWQPVGGVSAILGHGEKTTNPEMLSRGYDLQSKIWTFQAMVR